MKHLTLSLLSALLIQSLSAVEPLDISSQRQLFLDDVIIERMDALTRTMHQPVKRGPVLKVEEPWEGNIVTFSPPMWIPDEGVYKQVYECRGTVKRYALATSKDGVHWEKPKLGLVEFEGSKENNLFPTPDNHRLAQVVFDPDDPDPMRRYKGLLEVPGGRIPVISSDCLQWRKLDIHWESGDAGTLTFDREKRLFMALLKRPNPNSVGRSYDVAFSKDFINWSEPRFMFGMDKDRDQEMAIDVIRQYLVNPAMAKPFFIDPDPAIGWRRPEGKNHIPTWRAECYNFGVIPYEGIYLGLITVYYPTGQILPSRKNTDGFNLIQLAMSRDLKQWKRLGDRRPFLEQSPLTNGLVGNYDRLQIAAYNGIIQHRDELRFYYTGYKRRSPQHSLWPDGGPRDPATLSDSERADWLEDSHMAMCLAVLRRDGFVSLTAGEEAGQLITKPFMATGDQLLLNVNNHDGGQTNVEVLDEDGNPIPGFDFSNSVSLVGHSIKQPVQWKNDAMWSKLTGRTVRLRIQLLRADLYALWAETNSQ